MNDTPHEVWFYSRDGEKRGPVSFTDLQEMAKDASLNPRHDVVWRQGMEAWKPAGEVEGLFKRRIAEPPEVPVQTLATPYEPPVQESREQQMVKIEDWPGARRRSYLFVILVLPILMNLAAAWGAVMLNEQFGGEIAGIIALVAMVLPLVFWIYISLQRFVNVGMSRWWFLGNFVPFLNIWVGYRCFACPGGYAYHKKLDGPGIFLAIIYWLMVALGLLAIAAIIAVLLGAAGSPEFREQIEEVLRKAAETQS